MTIIRVRQIHTNFTTVNNSVINDARLSHKALGVWLRLISKHDGWEISACGLSTLFPTDGKDSVNTALKELCKYGYLVRLPTEKKGGRFQNPIMELYSECQLEEPLTDEQVNYLFSKTEFVREEFKKMFPKRIFRYGFSAAENPSQQKKDNENKDKEFVCVDSPPVGDSPPLEKEKSRFKRISKDLEISKDNLFKACVQERKDWSAEEIDSAWEILVNYQNPIHNWIAFCDGTIKNQRKMKALKNIEIKEPTCNNEFQDLDTAPLKTQSDITSASTSESDTVGPALAALRSLMPRRPQCSPT